MKTHDVVQGTPEWHALRATTYNASDAPAMLGCSPYETRTQLIARLATGLAREFSDYAQERIVDPGHRFEALARPLAEKIIGEDLYPISGSEDFGLDKPLGASLDGATITDEILWEHKRLNAALRAALPETGVGDFEVGARLDKPYRVQMEQQLMVDSDAVKVLFTASEWEQRDGEWVCVDARHCWYQSDPALRAEILGGWKQLAEDVKAYVPPAASAVEKIVAEPVEALPAPVVKVTGQIALVDNFKAFEERLREFLADKLIREPKTDEDFVNLDSQIKAMKAAREALKAAEAQMLAQVQPVDQAKKTKDMLDKLLQQNVSMAEGILDAEKTRRKGEIVAVGVKGLADHIAALNQRLGKPYMPAISADFGGAIKGLKSLASMEDKVATTLANAKIAASQTADKIEVNLRWLRENATEYAHLFADTAQLVLKAPDDFKAVAENRISTEKARVQSEQDRIREEAAAKARQDLINEQAVRQLTAVAAAPTPAAPAPAATATAIFNPLAATPVKVSPVPVAANEIVMNIGEINTRLAPLQITAAGLQSLGFQPVPRKGTGVYFSESDWPLMVEKLIQLLNQAHDLVAA